MLSEHVTGQWVDLEVHTVFPFSCNNTVKSLGTSLFPDFLEEYRTVRLTSSSLEAKDTLVSHTLHTEWSQGHFQSQKKYSIAPMPCSSYWKWISARHIAPYLPSKLSIILSLGKQTHVHVWVCVWSTYIRIIESSELEGKGPLKII